MTISPQTILADPPWPYRDKLPGGGRGAAKHYPLMAIDQIEDLIPRLEYEHVLELPANAHLYLWTTNGFVNEAWEVAKAWGFEPKTLVTWVKTKGVWLQHLEVNVEPRAHIQIGMGRSFRNATEQVIVAKRGRLPFNEQWRPTVFFAPRAIHSRKPYLFYDIVEAMSNPPYLELFARPPVREGWQTWGNEV